MTKLYASPLRVYLLLGLFALAGIMCGLHLPVSLFPNSNKPTIGVWIPYGNNTPIEFLDTYGRQLEGELRGISTENLEVEKLTAEYEESSAMFRVEFKWGALPKEALQEVRTRVTAFSARMPLEMREGVGVWTNQENNGFLAISFFSDARSPDDLYELLDPLLAPRLAQVAEAEGAGLYNPARKEILLELDPLRMATLQLVPRDIERAVTTALRGFRGGSITIGTQQLAIEMPRQVGAMQEMRKIRIPTPSGGVVTLGDVAKIDSRIMETESRSFKTNGAASLILFANPRAGGNVKKMAEDIIEIVKETKLTLPRDIEYRLIVDPSGFIRHSISNLLREVIVGCLLAVCILFLFIGSLRNTITAAIEIPLSMVLAFILMKLLGMNLNLISLGGLALSAGMNIDASVVVMENIFRHFDEVKGPLDYRRRLEIVVNAVSEVRFCVVASTIASLVVFLPLAFTSELTYAILGDLAKAVVFSHAFSAIVATILVPTVRLHLMAHEKMRKDPAQRSPIQRLIKATENAYGRTLNHFILSRKLKAAAYIGLPVLLAVLILTVLPRLPREIIGLPDTDWITLGVNTQGNTTIRQMETQTEELEARLLKKFGNRLHYTFTQIHWPNGARIMCRLKDKKDAQRFWKELENEFGNTPITKFWIGPWNPSELPIPNPPQLRIAVTGNKVEERQEVAQNLIDLLEASNLYFRISSDPNVVTKRSVVLVPNPDQWGLLESKTSRLTASDIADIARVATSGRTIENLTIDGRRTPLTMAFQKAAVTSIEDLAAFPIGLGGKIVPLKALASVERKALPPLMYREDGDDVVLIYGRLKRGEEGKADETLKKAEALVNGWKATHDDPLTKSGTAIRFEDAQKDLNNALRQLAIAVTLSILLIFVTLIIQFGSIMNALLVLVAIPLGFVGVLASLWLFHSTLSLNSVLGIILLNGIAVANSIILVDFLKRGVDEGRPPREAAINAGRKRLRPILITSLTTICAMLPIAIGFGEGGKILQPLGIAVAGGLWVSTILTLFVVPALQVDYLSWRKKRSLS